MLLKFALVYTGLETSIGPNQYFIRNWNPLLHLVAMFAVGTKGDTI
jgi:hypothetical protein